VRRTELDPAELGLEPAKLPDLIGGSPGHNAQVVRDVLAGKIGPVRDIVLLNAAAALLAFDGPNLTEPVVDQLRRPLERVAAAIDDGTAAELLVRWVDTTNRLRG